MKLYTRKDGTLAEALQFKGSDRGMDEGVFNLIVELHKEGIDASWRPTESTGVWDENPEGELYEVVILEHMVVRKDEWEDEVKLGEYIVKRDDEYYVMGGPLFESLYEEFMPITNAPEEWVRDDEFRLPYAHKRGCWRHIRDNDVVSNDAGKTYFRLSERPKYQDRGPIYVSEHRV